MIARDVMTSPVITISENATIQDAARLLIKERISAVPVLDEAGKLAGIVTESDLMRRAEIGTERHYSWWLWMLSDARTLATDYIKSHATSVQDVMTRTVITVVPETPLHEIAELFERNHIKRVPVVDMSGDLLGIVSRANIIQAVASAGPKLDVSLPDAAIRSKLLDELKQQPWAHAHKMNVMVTQGVVELWGFVDNDEERQAVNVAAKSIPGVNGVNDRLMRAPTYGY
ncbi:CBS domain-containing protein [Bradyrhizobium sp.]|uniref:CBS domain-containing protein n=1 Tax=Bradyrhizobium sp. TaxID=376 RepID=UPI0040377144